MNVDRLHIDSEEDGFHLLIKDEEGGWHDFHIHNVAIELLANIDETIRPWHQEAQRASAAAFRAPFQCDPDESGGYDLNDPKHPTFFDRMVGDA